MPNPATTSDWSSVNRAISPGRSTISGRGEIGSSLAAAHLQLGVALQAWGDIDGAVTSLERAPVDPSRADAPTAWVALMQKGTPRARCRR
jgi:hypothetical protein